MLLVALLLGIVSAPRSVATVYHSNGSAANIQTLHNTALTGDTITVPSAPRSRDSRTRILCQLRLPLND